MGHRATAACLPACWLHRAALRGDLRACLLLPPTRRAGITISTGAGLCEVHWPGQAVVMTQPRINQVRLPCRSIVARTCGATLPRCAHCHCRCDCILHCESELKSLKGKWLVISNEL